MSHDGAVYGCTPGGFPYTFYHESVGWMRIGLDSRHVIRSRRSRKENEGGRAHLLFGLLSLSQEKGTKVSRSPHVQPRPAFRPSHAFFPNASAKISHYLLLSMSDCPSAVIF